jgi:hypothetical protein
VRVLKKLMKLFNVYLPKKSVEMADGSVHT